MRILLLAQHREQSPFEEVANSLSHGIGLIVVVVASPFLITQATRLGDRMFVVGVSLFVGSMIFLYLASTLYHALPAGKIKRIFQIIEHSAIFFLIAGTYTPFALGVLRGVWGWTVLGIIWGLAFTGVTLKIRERLENPVISTGFYLLMGWFMLIAVNPMYTPVSISGLAWLLAGGLAYTIGVVFFATDTRMKCAHAIWHLFVMAGTSCHFLAVLWYSA